MRIISVLVVLAWSIAANAQDFVSRYIEECGNDTLEKHIVISPRMMEMASEDKELANDKDIRMIMSNLKSLQILRREGQCGTERMDKAGQMLERHSNRYQTIRTYDKDGEHMQISLRKYHENPVELVMLHSSSDGYMILSMTGNLDDEVMEKLQNILQGKLGIGK